MDGGRAEILSPASRMPRTLALSRPAGEGMGWNEGADCGSELHNLTAILLNAQVCFRYANVLILSGGA